MRACYVIGLILMMPAAAQEIAETYLCIAEQATGLVFDAAAGQWRSTAFNVANGRYQLRVYAEPQPFRADSEERIHGDVRQIGLEGKKGFFTLCMAGFGDDRRITCTDPGGVQKFRLDANTSRYYLIVGAETTISDMTAAIHSGEGVLPAAIEIGTCQRT